MILYTACTAKKAGIPGLFLFVIYFADSGIGVVFRFNVHYNWTLMYMEESEGMRYGNV